ncbi:competence protein CoiA family protein [Kocuria rosea]|uniref:competence protein CoiA family protein n=1 Tax=Kocuria rosea TaxID=1275 RepID=UPI0025B7488A|nr:competence protein CoiA family protein [Kocuria rosea]WJZ68633.1 competence protein CoiA family protein [Kocuria rosea]
MPFKAMLDGEQIISFLLTEEDWALCRATSKKDPDKLVLPDTRVPCFGRTSSKGLRHFVRRAGTEPEGETAPESWQHLMLKKLVAEQALSLGWEVDVEVPAPGGEWVADTMMTKGNRRVVIEAQWSQQTLDEYQRRQQRYTEAGIECWWITRHNMNKSDGLRRELPMIPLMMDRFKESEEFIAQVASKQLTIAQLVTAILEEWFVDEQVGELMMYPYPCWKCGRECVLWRCLWLPYAAWEMDKSETSPWVKDIVEERTREWELRMAALQISSSKMAAKEYMAFRCPGCGAVLGDNFLFGEAEDRLRGHGEDTRHHRVKVLTGERSSLRVGNPRWRRVPEELTPRAWSARTTSQEAGSDGSSSTSVSVSVGLAPHQVISKLFGGPWL